jgi:hypothetical protein
MRAIKEEQRPLVEAGIDASSARLLDSRTSPLLLGVTTGMVCFADAAADESPFAFITDIRISDDFKGTGFPRELWLSVADHMEDIARGIREGKLDGVIQAWEEKEPEQEITH